VSERAARRRAHLSWLALREGVPSAGANRRNVLVGKQSIISDRNTSRSISIPAKWSSSLGRLHGVDCFPNSPERDTDLGRLLCSGQSRSALLRLVRSSCDSAAMRSISKPFSCYELSRGVRSKPLTRRCSEQKIAAHSGTSNRSSLCKSPNGPVEGLSPEIVESAA
jgi:hypothetical protein